MTTAPETIVAALLETDAPVFDPEAFIDREIEGDFGRRERAAKFRPRRNESQYAEGYLRANGVYGEGNGISVGQYLSSQLRGSARTYFRKYAAALTHALDQRVDAGVSYMGAGKDGVAAYYPVPEETLARWKEKYAANP